MSPEELVIFRLATLRQAADAAMDEVAQAGVLSSDTATHVGDAYGSFWYANQRLTQLKDRRIPEGNA